LRYLITGGAGFIGSHLAESLLVRGDHVVLLDNLSTGSVENIRHLKSSERMRYHLDNIENRQLLAELVDDADVVVHLAAAVGVKLIVERPLESLVTNIRGSEVVLEKAHKYGKKVLLTSTSEIYGKSPSVPMHEDSDRLLGSPLVGRWSYSTSKAVDEILAHAYWKAKGLPTVIVRIFQIANGRPSAMATLLTVKSQISGRSYLNRKRNFIRYSCLTDSPLKGEAYHGSVLCCSFFMSVFFDRAYEGERGFGVDADN